MAPTMNTDVGPRPRGVPPPPPPAAQPPTALDAAVAAVAAHKDVWRRTSPGAYAALLARTLEATYAVSDAWALADAQHRGLSRWAPTYGLEHLLGPAFVLRTLRLLRDSVVELAQRGRPRIPGPVYTRPDGRLAVGLYPRDRYDRLLFRGFSAEAWMLPGITAAELDQHLALAYRGPRDARGRVCLVLGAGNISSLAPNDALYALFVARQVVVLKLSPVLAYQEPLLARAFAPLIEAGVLRLVQGGADVGAALAHHPDVDDVLLTGATEHHDALVYGAGPEGARRKALGERLLDKPVLAELSSVTPVLVVPGPWTRAELRHKAEEIAASLSFNAGATCITPRMLVTPRDWPLRGALLDALRGVLRDVIPTRPAYYPGSAERTARFLAAHPDAERLGKVHTGCAPWLLATGLDAEREDELAFREDPFCGVLSEVPLSSARSLEDYLDRAVAFCNERLMGNLNAMVLAHPRSLRLPGAAAALDRALARLRYGNVVLNAGPGLPYLLAIPPWGAYGPDQHRPTGSGTGFVHNTSMLDGVEKTVCRAPFHIRPRPPWFSSHRHQREAWLRFTDFEARHDLRTLVPLLWKAGRSVV